MKWKKLDPDPRLSDADPKPWTGELIISTCDCEDGLDALPAHGVVHHAEVLPAVLHQRLPYDQGPAHLKPKVRGSDLAEWSERLAVNARVATVLESIPTSSDTMESEGRKLKKSQYKGSMLDC